MSILNRPYKKQSLLQRIDRRLMATFNTNRGVRYCFYLILATETLQFLLRISGVS